MYMYVVWCQWSVTLHEPNFSTYPSEVVLQCMAHMPMVVIVDTKLDHVPPSKSHAASLHGTTYWIFTPGKDLVTSDKHLDVFGAEGDGD